MTAIFSTRKPSVGTEVHVALTEAPCKLLTVWRDGNWHLPFFKYEEQPSDYESGRCCCDLGKLLDVKSEHSLFRVAAELLPRDTDAMSPFFNPDGAVRLTFVETTATEQLIALPSHAKWMQFATFRTLLQSPQFTDKYYFHVGAALSIFLDECTAAAGASHTLCGQNSTSRAAHFLSSVVRQQAGLSKVSDTERHPTISLSTILRMETSAGFYYLKAPMLVAEVGITECVARLFPDDTLRLVSADAICFVAAEFARLRTHREAVQEAVMKKVARMQRQALVHTATLKEAGLPDYSPHVLSQRIGECLKHPLIGRLAKDNKESLSSISHRLTQLCGELEASSIPCTLVHGDLTFHNVGVRADVDKDDGLILFDWQNSYLSHPFCDLYLIHGEWCHEAVDAYLSSWEDFATKDDITRTLPVASALGWFIRIDATLQARPKCRSGRKRGWMDDHVKGCFIRFLETCRELSK